MKHIDLAGHVTGKSLYVDDLPLQQGTLFAVVLGSPIAHGRIRSIHADRAKDLPGFVGLIGATDIAGENQIGGIIADEPLLADEWVHFQGQPVVIVVAESEEAARRARSLVELQVEEHPCVTSPREAYARGSIIGKERCFQIGDPDSAWEQCRHLVSGQGYCAGQEHLYIETQGAYAFTTEAGHIRIVSSTQGPTAVQRTAARVLGLAMHAIEVDVRRLGGGFGGKEDQATPWAVMAALACQVTGRAVKLVLHRHDDMMMTGKRHPYEFDYRIGLDADLRILAYEVMLYQDAGAAADLSPAVLERSLFHFNNSYFIPHARATAASCRTNVTPHTAFRGFGGPQGMFAMECAIAAAAEQIGVQAHEIQARNLLRDGDEFPYGQIAQGARAKACWARLTELNPLDRLDREIAAFNGQNPWKKRGYAIMPICFGISFTKTHMNQAAALVHVYQDGSVAINTGAVEMGQGVSTKMIQVAAHVFGLDAQHIRIEPTNTTRVANTSPTAASSSADLNGHALLLACNRIKERMATVARDLCGSPSVEFREGRVHGVSGHVEFAELASQCYLRRVDLSEHAHYATPSLHFDTVTEKGHPFAYHVYGCALVIATVDCLRGIYQIDRVHAVHDFGSSMNEAVDLGQAEGGIVQGLGWMTMEELAFGQSGKLLSNSLSTYKVPDIYAAPGEMRVDFLNEPGSPAALFRSKAVGEPPLMYGIGGYFAIRRAMRLFDTAMACPFSAPMTPEKVLMALYPETAPSGDERGTREAGGVDR